MTDALPRKAANASFSLIFLFVTTFVLPDLLSHHPLWFCYTSVLRSYTVRIQLSTSLCPLLRPLAAARAVIKAWTKLWTNGASFVPESADEEKKVKHSCLLEVLWWCVPLVHHLTTPEPQPRWGSTLTFPALPKKKTLWEPWRFN